MKRILFLGSKPIGYSCLNFLLQNSTKLNCKVVGILSNDNLRFDKSLSIKSLANDYDIPL